MKKNNLEGQQNDGTRTTTLNLYIIYVLSKLEKLNLSYRKDDLQNCLSSFLVLLIRTNPVLLEVFDFEFFDDAFQVQSRHFGN